MTTNIGVIGIGPGIGYSHLKMFHSLGVNVYAADRDESQIEQAREELGIPTHQTTTDYQELLANRSIDGIVVVTPSHIHTQIVQDALNADKHVFVEKPITMNGKEADELVRLARDRELILTTGHHLVHSEGTKILKSHIEKGTLGDLRYIRSDRMLHNDAGVNGRRRDDVIWDLAIHDIYNIANAVGVNASDFEIKDATVWSSKDNGVNDIARLDFLIPMQGQKVPARVYVSWARRPNEDIRKTMHATLTVSGEDLTAVIENNWMGDNITLKPTSDSNGENARPQFALYRTPRAGVERFMPGQFSTDPYESECIDFITSIEGGGPARGANTLAQGEDGLEAVRLVEQIQERIASSV